MPLVFSLYYAGVFGTERWLSFCRVRMTYAILAKALSSPMVNLQRERSRVLVYAFRLILPLSRALLLFFSALTCL